MTHFSDRKVVSGSTKYIDTATRLNQDVHFSHPETSHHINGFMCFCLN